MQKKEEPHGRHRPDIKQLGPKGQEFRSLRLTNPRGDRQGLEAESPAPISGLITCTSLNPIYALNPALPRISRLPASVHSARGASARPSAVACRPRDPRWFFARRALADTLDLDLLRQGFHRSSPNALHPALRAPPLKIEWRQTSPIPSSLGFGDYHIT